MKTYCALPSCGKELINVKGKKPKVYCDSKCKQRHWHQKKQEGKGMVTISRPEYEELLSIKERSTTFDVQFKEVTTSPKRLDLITKKPIVKDLNKDKQGAKAYNPKDNPAHKTDIELTIGGQAQGKTAKTKSYIQQRREQKLSK